MNWHVSGLNDVVAWLWAAAAFFAMAHAFRHGDFVRVTLAARGRAREDAAARSTSPAQLIAAVSVAYLTWWATSFTYESWEFAEMAMGLSDSDLDSALTFAIGCLLLLIAVVDELVGVLRGHKPSYQRAVEERHAAGDFSSESEPPMIGTTSSARACCSSSWWCCSRAAVWIAMTLAIVGWIGQAFFTNTLPGKNLFSAFWGSNASWELAALPLFIWMGEILFRTLLSEQMFRRPAPWLNNCRAG